jgi:hypothetical protein
VISAGSSSSITVGMATVELRISGDSISWERLSFDAGLSGASVLIEEVITFSDVGRAPAVVAPAGPPTATATS